MLKPTHKAIQAYYQALRELSQLSLVSEGAVAPAFAKLLDVCARQKGWILSQQHTLTRKGKRLQLDGALLDDFRLVHGVWEANDSSDDLAQEVRKKFAAGYPADNILFQAPTRLILWQDGREVLDVGITQPGPLVEALEHFFGYQPPAFEEWGRAVAEFKDKVPQLAQGLLARIHEERASNKRFVQAFEEFLTLCRDAINPNLSVQAVEEMLIQHLLTERIFRKVFNNPDFISRNVIAREIEGVIRALTSSSFQRDDFLRSLDRFYGAIELTAATIDEYTQKQEFLNTVYEQFFQGFSVKVADTHGIVYTPQPIVEFMVRSVDEILHREFGKTLGDPGVHVLDPFVGTGNFILRVMRAIPRSRLAHKYAHDLHCNEVMLLPYYIAAMNIEHEFVELTGQYKEFPGLCLVDTFELAEGRQMSLFVQENTERVQAQQATDIFVILGNPPYNARQVNENDNNKNRSYPALDHRVAETYARDSRATNKNALSDVYIKAFRWAADRIGAEGIVAFVTNSSFLDSLSADGMRKHLVQDFDRVYVLDLKGNIRKDSMKDGIPLGEKHTVFGQAAMVGIAITILIKSKKYQDHKIFYNTVDFRATRDQKFTLLEQVQTVDRLVWQELTPDSRHTWLTEGLRDEYETFLPMGTKEAKAGAGEQVIFSLFSNGLKSNRDTWVYNFNPTEVERNVRRMIDTYNTLAVQWERAQIKPDLDNLMNDPTRISWSDTLKRSLRSHTHLTYKPAHIRSALYRPFTQQHLYFDKHLNERRYQMPHIFPTPQTEEENRAIWLKVGSAWPMFALMVNRIPDLLPQGGTQCFPLYSYDEDGGNRRDNITDWALEKFRAHYGGDGDGDGNGNGDGETQNLASLQGVDPSSFHIITSSHHHIITKRDIFHYTYALLHHPDYRERYAANLRRELPRLPLVPDFWGFVRAGERLAALHVHYDKQPEYPLTPIENPAVPLSWRVEKPRLSRDKSQIVYNDFLALGNIPPETFAYRLGNRSALDWLLDQYRPHTDPRSGILNDPNRPDDPQAILRLIAQIVTVSVETARIVVALPPLAQ